MTGPIAVADGVFWVGKRLPNDDFQCHAYLLVNGDDSVLIDPGSVLTIAETLANVAAVTDLSSIRHVVCHHPDPDIAGSLSALSEALPRSDVQVVTEWRARALLKHYGHRFQYWLIEEHDWELPLGGERSLQFQLTPYLHFPGAFVSYDPSSRTLFSSDIFGGFVTAADDLRAHDFEAAFTAMRPFHQHYMPSRALLSGSLARVSHRWPHIDRIAPQHGQLLEGPMVQQAFDALAELECGVFALADGDHELERLLRLSEAKVQFTDSLLAVSDPAALVASIDAVLRTTHHKASSALYVDVPDDGWTMWTTGARVLVTAPPSDSHALVELEGRPVARLALEFSHPSTLDEELIGMFQELAASIRPSVDQYVARVADSHRIAALRRATQTDPLTGLSNRRALEAELPRGQFAVVALDLDHFKSVNDRYGHARGDEVLRQVATAIQASVRDGDRAYRTGGEEFLVVAPRTDRSTGRDIAERIRANVSGLHFPDQAPSHVTVSAGVVSATTNDELDFPAVLAEADQALYEAKSRGRDQVCVAPHGVASA